MTVYYPEGAYRGEIVDQGLSQSSNGNAQIWLKIQVDGGQQYDAHERMIYWTITEKTIDFVLEKLELLGFTGQSFKDLDLNGNRPQSFVGRTEDFWCKIEYYDGKEKERWDLSRGDTAVKSLDEADARKRDAMFGKKLKERFRGTKAKAVEAEEPMQTDDVPAEDEIPF